MQYLIYDDMAATRIHANQTPSQSPLHRMQGKKEE